MKPSKNEELLYWKERAESAERIIASLQITMLNGKTPKMSLLGFDGKCSICHKPLKDTILLGLDPVCQHCFDHDDTLQSE